MRILIIDDHPAIHRFLEQTLNEVVSACELTITSTVNEAARAIEDLDVDFAVCDLQIVTGKSLVIPALCSEKEIPFMVYSSHVNLDLVESLDKLGVSCYVSKSSSYEEFVDGVRALIGGGSFFCSVVKKTRREDRKDLPLPRLNFSKKQGQVLSLLASGFTQQEVSEKLFISERTVQNHLSMLRDSNKCSSTTELLRRYTFWE